MKRLTLMPMLMLVALAATTMLAQSKDLAGTWALDTEKSTSKGPATMVITLTAKEFSVKMGSATVPPMTFKLDGTETQLEHGAKGKAVWKGNKIEATLISEKGGAQSVTFSREGDYLVQEGVSPRGPEKLYYKKAPAKS